MVLKVHRKGIVVFPKKLREMIGVNEGDHIIVEVIDGKLIIKPLKPRIVEIDRELVEKILREEYGKEEDKFEEIIGGGKTSSRH